MPILILQNSADIDSVLIELMFQNQTMFDAILHCSHYNVLQIHFRSIIMRMYVL